MFDKSPIYLCRDGVPLIELYQATHWLARLKGLFAYPPLSDSQGLLIRPCNAVHTFGMKYSIDVVFLTKGGSILKVAQLATGSIAACRHAHAVVEMKQGMASRLDLRVGQTLREELACPGVAFNV